MAFKTFSSLSIGQKQLIHKRWMLHTQLSKLLRLGSQPCFIPDNKEKK